MPSVSPLQLEFSVSHEGVLSVAFKGKSGAEDVPLFMDAINARLRAAAPPIRRATFDLSGINAFANAAGRLLDLACSYARQLAVEIRIPKDIYTFLSGIEKKMPTLGEDERARWRGVTICVVKPLDDPGSMLDEDAAEQETEEEEVIAEEHVILACTGKVRAIDGSTVSVTLTTDEGQVVGEFDKRQFSGRDIVVGMTFEYQASITGAGRTMVTIDPLTVQRPTDEELIDDVENLGVDFHKY